MFVEVNGVLEVWRPSESGYNYKILVRQPTSLRKILPGPVGVVQVYREREKLCVVEPNPFFCRRRTLRIIKVRD